MKISQSAGLGHNKYYVKLLSKKVMDQDEIDRLVIAGEKLLSVEEYHRILDENIDILKNVCNGKEVVDTYLYEFNSPVEIFNYFDDRDNVNYTAHQFKEGQTQPVFLFGKLVGEKYDEKYKN
ncbi:MAG: hypothetical protein V4622_07680 [Bacteroidota bacterium]